MKFQDLHLHCNTRLHTETRGFTRESQDRHWKLRISVKFHNPHLRYTLQTQDLQLNPTIHASSSRFTQKSQDPYWKLRHQAELSGSTLKSKTPNLNTRLLNLNIPTTIPRFTQIHYPAWYPKILGILRFTLKFQCFRCDQMIHTKIPESILQSQDPHLNPKILTVLRIHRRVTGFTLKCYDPHLSPRIHTGIKRYPY